MEKITFKIKPSDKRNEMHFEVQRRNRAQVYKNKKVYNRKSFKLKDYE